MRIASWSLAPHRQWQRLSLIRRRVTRDRSSRSPGWRLKATPGSPILSRKAYYRSRPREYTRAGCLERNLSTFIQEKIRSQHCISRRSTGGGEGWIVVARYSCDGSRREVGLEEIDSPGRRLRGECDKMAGGVRGDASQDGPCAGRKGIRSAHEQLHVSGRSQAHCEIRGTARQICREKHPTGIQNLRPAGE